MAQNDALSAKQHQAIVALLTNANVSKAAEAAGVGRTTLQRWLIQPEFKAALQAAEQESLATLSRLMAGYAIKPLVVLLEMMDDKKQPGGVRVRAAAVFLSILLKYRELVILEERLATIEVTLNLRGQ